MSTAPASRDRENTGHRVLVKEAKCGVLAMPLSCVTDMVRFHLMSDNIPPDPK